MYVSGPKYSAAVDSKFAAVAPPKPLPLPLPASRAGNEQPGVKSSLPLAAVAAGAYVRAAKSFGQNGLAGGVSPLFEAVGALYQATKGTQSFHGAGWKPELASNVHRSELDIALHLCLIRLRQPSNDWLLGRIAFLDKDTLGRTLTEHSERIACEIALDRNAAAGYAEHPEVRSLPEADRRALVASLAAAAEDIFKQ